MQKVIPAEATDVHKNLANSLQRGLIEFVEIIAIKFASNQVEQRLQSLLYDTRN